MQGQHITPSPGVGVVAEIGAIAERRSYALTLWDGPIQALWDSLVWFQEQSRRQAEMIAGGNREKALADAFVRCMDTIDEILVAIGKLEAEARAQVRGMDQFIDWAKQNSRIGQLGVDAWLHQRDPFLLEPIAGGKLAV